MISQEQRKEMLEIIGFKHIAKISMYFYDKKIFSRTETPYHSMVISEVFNGRKANPKIEQGIFDFVAEYPAILKAEQERRNEIIANTKKELDEQE
jgi:hypothetical protein